MYIYVCAAVLCVIFSFIIIIHAEVGGVGGSGYRLSESDAANLLLVGHIRVSVVFDQLIDAGELDVLEVEHCRRTFHVEVLYTARMSASATVNLLTLSCMAFLFVCTACYGE